MRKKTPPRRAPLPFEVRNLNHRAPVTRREFLGRGMLATSGVVIGAGSLLSMLARPRRAFGQTPPPSLDPDILALVNGSTASGGCNIHAGAGKVPFIAFDLGGGGNIAGSNALVGGMGGQLDFLTTAGYNKLGVPGSMIPGSGGANSFVDQSLGLAMHSDSAYLRGIQSIAAATTLGGVNGAVIPAISQTDTDLNPHNPMYGINSAGGAAGALVVLIGTEATVSGGNSMAPSYMINQSVLPTVVTRPSDVTGLVSTGQLVASGALDQTAAVDVLESAVRISNMKLAQVGATGNPALDPSVQTGVQCSYVDAAYLVDQYGNASATLDPTQDSLIVGTDGSGGIFTTAQMQDSDFLATASVMKMVIDGYAGAGTIEMGGYDYHDSTRATGETRDFKAGQCIGACLQYAALRGVPLMIYVFSDGSLASSGMIDTSMAGRDKGVWTADNTATAASLMLVYDPNGRPTALQNQIGSYNSDGTVNATGSIAANAVNLLAETVVLNYMALHGQATNFESVVWSGGVPQGLGSADNYKSLIAFTQLASVSGPGGTVPGL
ncbi:MAG TPA: hypothetical protein VHX52_02025 [Steroidobacteraceae bacterium]|nr:hypothetical protein [Steroidobacteraceae bacterium]